MKYLKQYGLRRTGTNYTVALLRKNAEDVTVYVNKGGDKHELPHMRELLLMPEPSPTHFVINVKHPYAWMVSFVKWTKQFQEVTPELKEWACRQWNWHYMVWSLWLTRNPGIFVRYEDLLNDMPQTVRGICVVLQLELKGEPEDVTQHVLCAGEADGKEYDRISGTSFDARRAYWESGAYMGDLGDDKKLVDDLINWELAMTLRYERK